MERIRVSPISKMVGRSKVKDWMQKRDNQAGMSAAGQVLTEGAMDDPYKAIIQAVGAFMAGRNQDRQRMGQEKLLAEEKAVAAARQAKMDARADEEYGLKKRSLEGELSAAEEKRRLAEEERQKIEALLPTMSEEDRRILGPLVGAPDRFYSVYDQIGDNRRNKEQSDRDYAEKTRSNQAQESFEERRLRLEGQRVTDARAAREAEAGKLKNENKVIERGGQLITYSPEGEVLKTVPVPRSAAEREELVVKLMNEKAYSLEQAMAVVDQLDKARAPQVAPQTAPGQAGAEDETILAAIEQARAQGSSDEDIMRRMADLPAPIRAKALRLMGLAKKPTRTLP